jgi:hypothetical protein
MSETEEEEVGWKLVWPPTKEDLQRLYLEQKLSARKIAKLYGLKYASEKTAESTILYHLKRNRIKRRDSTEHVRKVTDDMAKDWIRRYEAGESLKQIAGDEVSPVTVFIHLRKRGVQLRDKIDALRKALTKHQKRPFSGDPREKAYLVGFAQGDLYVTRHGRAVRVKTGSTHPAMAELFVNLFGKYGPVYLYPRKAKVTGYEWSMDADLDESFQFLMEKSKTIPEFVIRRGKLFFDYLGGFFDAEGSISLHRSAPFHFEIRITNTNLPLLEKIIAKLSREGFAVSTGAGKSGFAPSSRVWRITIWRYHDVHNFLRRVTLRHPERKAKGRITLQWNPASPSIEQGKSENLWDRLVAEIKYDKTSFIELAKLASN